MFRPFTGRPRTLDLFHSEPIEGPPESWPDCGEIPLGPPERCVLGSFPIPVDRTTPMKGHRWGIVNVKVNGSQTICCVRAATIDEAEQVAAAAMGLPLKDLCAHRLPGTAKRRAGRFA